MGAYLSLYAPFIPFIGAGMSPGVYDLPACHVRVRDAFTNTVPVDAYRGAGRPEAAYVIERLVDVAARELGVAPDALRRKNFIKATPYTTATGKTYDSGDFAHHLGRAQDSADWNSFERRLAKSREAGRLRGIGIATYVEACGAIGSCPAVMNAVLDALWRAYRVRHLDMPATPERVWAAIAEGRLARSRNRDRGVIFAVFRPPWNNAKLCGVDAMPTQPRLPRGHQFTEGARDDPYRACRCSARVRGYDAGGPK